MSLLKRGKWVLAIAGAVIGGGVAQAATYSSSANAATVRLGPINVVSPDAVQGSGTGSYTVSGTTATLNQSASLGASGIASLSERVTGTINNERAIGTGTQARGMVTIAAPSIGFDSSTTLPLVGTIVTTLFGIDADTISSSSTVTNSNGVLTAVGLSSIGNLAVNPAANLSFSLGNALTLTLNEQIQSMSAGALSLETNALHLSLNNFLVGGNAFTGDIILGHSAASVTGAATAAVPEPAGWALMLAGFGLVGGALRTTRRSARTVLA